MAISTQTGISGGTGISGNTGVSTETGISNGGGPPPAGPEFIISADTTKAGSASDTIILPVSGAEALNWSIDWGDSNVDSLNTHTYSSGGIFTITITPVLTTNINNWKQDNAGDRLKFLDILQWGNFEVTQTSVFRGCENFTLLTATDGPLFLGMTGAGAMAMFEGCTNINTPVGHFDTALVETMQDMFRDCPAMDQSFGDFSLANMAGINCLATFIFGTGTGISTANYDDTLIKWAAQDPNLPVASGRVDFANTLYSAGAATTSRAVLTGSPNNWDIRDAGQVP